MEKPRQGFAGLWNISFGFFGIQIGFALQNANMSRVFQTLGASMDDLPALWVAAPLTGLIVQPIIGYMSDRTWNRFGRRRPYFLTGAILAALALFVMPLSPSVAAPLVFAAAMLWLLNNVSGSPVILEAQLPEYRWGSRFSVYTGLPTVQGWNWHERQQRSVVPAVVERRVSQVQELYNTTDIARAQHLLDTYNVRYIIVGGLERATYTAEGLAKFDALAQQGDLRVVYQGGAVTIYEIAGRAPAARPAAPAAPLPAPDTFRSPQP